MEEKKVLLPQTLEQLEQLIERLGVGYGIIDNDETRYSVTKMILQLPPTQSSALDSYFADGILRGIAQNVVYPIHRDVVTRLEAKAKIEQEKERAELEAQKETALKLVGSDDQPFQGA